MNEWMNGIKATIVSISAAHSFEYICFLFSIFGISSLNLSQILKQSSQKKNEGEAQNELMWNNYLLFFTKSGLRPWYKGLDCILNGVMVLPLTSMNEWINVPQIIFIYYIQNSFFFVRRLFLPNLTVLTYLHAPPSFVLY